MSEQWTLDENTSGQPAYIYSGAPPEESRIVGKIYSEIDAAFIVKAVKSHDALVRALEQIKIVCIDNAATTVRHDLALEFVGGIAARAIASVVGTAPTRGGE